MMIRGRYSEQKSDRFTFMGMFNEEDSMESIR